MGNIDIGAGTLNGNVDIKSGTLSGTNISISSTKCGVFGNAASQASAYTQTYATTTKTHANMTSATVATTASTNVTPFGYTTAAQADAIITAINALRNDVINLKGVVNAMIDDMQTYGVFP